MRRGWVQGRWKSWIGTGLVGLACLGFAVAAPAAELQLRSECQSHGPMVTLSEVAEVVGGEPAQREELGRMELFPSPPAGGKRFVRAREIQDMLMVRGVNLAQHQFSGSSQVTVIGGGPEKSPGILPIALVRKAERRLSESVVQYLKEYVSGTEAWKAELTLDSRQTRLVEAAEKLVVRGGAAPWLGSQRFEVTAQTAETATRFEVLAEITAGKSVVTVTRPIGRGDLITAADVQLVPGQSTEVEAAAFHSIDEVVGKEARQAISAGRPINRDAIRSPVVVRRGEVVTVYARSAGIRVRTVARAREEGSIDDLITVEAMDTRKAFFARVCGVQEVEIFARAVDATGTAKQEPAPLPTAATQPKAVLPAREAELTSWNSPKQTSNARMHLSVGE